MCGICDVENKKYKDDFNLFTDEDVERIILAVLHGTISVRRLDLNSFLKVARKLSEGVNKGYGKTLFELQYGTEDWLMLRELTRNVYIFSAAKQYHQIKDMQAALKEVSAALVDNDRVALFHNFKKKAKEIFLEYNSDWLRTEYNSAIAQARSASQWQEIVKDAKTLPMLTYHTVGDARVRPTHAELDGISRPVGDAFWNSYFPPNGWNCRCTVLQNDESKTTDLSKFVHPSDVPDIFRFNAGKKKIIFSPRHPYFKISKRDKEWAKQNFGMPTS